MADPTIPAGHPVWAASPGPPAVRPAGWRPQVRTGGETAGTVRAHAGTEGAPEWPPGPGRGDAGGRDPLAYPQGARRDLLPEPAGAPRRSEKALLAVIQQAYVEGVSMWTSCSTSSRCPCGRPWG